MKFARVYEEFESASRDASPEDVAKSQKLLNEYAKMVAGEVVVTKGPTKEKVDARE